MASREVGKVGDGASCVCISNLHGSKLTLRRSITRHSRKVSGNPYLDLANSTSEVHKLHQANPFSNSILYSSLRA